MGARAVLLFAFNAIWMSTAIPALDLPHELVMDVNKAYRFVGLRTLAFVLRALRLQGHIP